MVSVLASSVEDRRSGQSKDNKTGISRWCVVTDTFGRNGTFMIPVTDNSGNFLVRVKYVAMKMKFFSGFPKTLFKQNLFHGILN
jgi:hypothetical protein